MNVGMYLSHHRSRPTQASTCHLPCDSRAAAPPRASASSSAPSGASSSSHHTGPPGLCKTTSHPRDTRWDGPKTLITGTETRWKDARQDAHCLSSAYVLRRRSVPESCTKIDGPSSRGCSRVLWVNVSTCAEPTPTHNTSSQPPTKESNQ